MTYKFPKEPALTATEADFAATEIYKACKGIGCDEKRLISALSKLTSTTCQQVSKAFKTAYGQDVAKFLKNETSGNLEKICIALTMTSSHLEAKYLKDAFSGTLTTDEPAIINVLGGKSNQEVEQLKAAFQELCDKNLERTLEKETSGHMRHLFVGLIQAQRDDVGNLEADLETLYKAGQGRWGTDETAIIKFFTTRSNSYLQKLFKLYETTHQVKMERIIKKEFSGTAEKVLLNYVMAIQNPALFYATLMNDSMKGMGTNEEELISLIGQCREPSLMGAIKKEYLDKFEVSLISKIKKETSGHLEAALVAVLERGKEVYEDEAISVVPDLMVAPPVTQNSQPITQEAPLGERATLVQGAELRQDTKLENNDYFLIMQGDGNLVIYKHGSGPIWASNTCGNGQGPFTAVMQGDGNFVIYAASGPTWATQTQHLGGGGRMFLSQEGKLLLKYGDEVKWSS